MNFLLKANDGRDKGPNSYALAKTLEGERRISSFSFCGQLADYYSHFFSLIHPLDECPFTEMRTCGQSKISSCCICVWCKSKELGGSRSARFPTPMVESFVADLLPAIKSYWTESHLELFISLRLNHGAQGEHLTSLLSWIAAWILAKCVLSVYLVNELVLVVLWKVIGQSRIWNSVKHQQQSYSLKVCGVHCWWSSWGVVSWFWCKFFEELVLFQGMRMKFRDKIM